MLLLTCATGLPLLLGLSVEGSGYDVRLANGRVQHAVAVEEAGAIVRLRFAQGFLEVDATEVVAIQPTRTPAPSPPREGSDRAPVARHRLELTDLAVEVALPAGFRRPADEADRLPTFHSEDGQVSVRFGEGGNAADLWREPGFVKQHHAGRYPGFRILAESFTTIGDRAAWLMTFRYRHGEQERDECLALIAVRDTLVVVDVTTPPDHRPSARALTESIGRSVVADPS